MIDRLEPLPPLGTFVADILSIDQVKDGAAIAALEIALPLELDLLIGGDRVLALGASPPTQRIETTVLPVFHNLRVTLMADEMEGEDADTAS